MIDRKKLQENFEYFDKEMVLEIIDIFINEYPDRIAKIKSDIAEKDLVALKFDAHSIKGVVANFQRDGEVTLLAAELEEQAGRAVDRETRTLMNLPETELAKIHLDISRTFPRFLSSVEAFYNDLINIRKLYE